MTDTNNQEQVREQLRSLTENAYKQGFRDGQEAVAIVFDKLDAGNEEANNFYREIARVVRGLKLIDSDRSVH